MLEIFKLFKRWETSIIAVENPYEDYFVVKMKRPAGFQWMPGQHAIFSLPYKGLQGRRWRVFSIASTPEEDLLIIGTRVKEQASDFKRKLISMEKGDSIFLRGAFGKFTVQLKEESLLMIARGVGITPIRSLALHLKKDYPERITIIYESSEYHLFYKELEAISDENNNIRLHLVTRNEETMDLMNNCILNSNKPIKCLLSGNPRFVKHTKEALIQKGIPKGKIFRDSFFGYK